MQATVVPPDTIAVPSGALPMGTAIPDPIFLELYAEQDDDGSTPPIEDLDEILDARCASL